MFQFARSVASCVKQMCGSRGRRNGAREREREKRESDRDRERKKETETTDETPNEPGVQDPNSVVRCTGG